MKYLVTTIFLHFLSCLSGMQGLTVGNIVVCDFLPFQWYGLDRLHLKIRHVQNLNAFTIWCISILICTIYIRNGALCSDLIHGKILLKRAIIWGNQLKVVPAGFNNTTPNIALIDELHTFIKLCMHSICIQKTLIIIILLILCFNAHTLSTLPLPD